MTRNRKRVKSLPKRLTREEAAALLAVPNRRAPTGIRNRALLRVYYRCGLRCSEALNLSNRDVNLAGEEITVWKGKGEKDRVVGIDAQTLEILDRWKAIRPKSDWFFCATSKGHEGKQLDTGYVRAMTARYGRRAGIEIRVHPHQLRHSFATELLEEGVPVHVVQKLLGHERLDTTELYLHVVDAEMRRYIVDRLG